MVDIGREDKNLIRQLGVFNDVNVHGDSFRSPKRYKHTKQAFWCVRNLHGIVWNKGCLDYNEVQNVLPKDVKVGYFSKGKEKFKLLRNFTNEEVEELDDHGCPKIQELVGSNLKM